MNINCPACGAECPSTLKYAKLLGCLYCKTTLFLEDDAVKYAGEKSVITILPSILSRGKRYKYRQWQFQVYGRIQFEYSNGLWDEWWVVLDNGEGKWISVDEGDIAIQSPIDVNSQIPAYTEIQIGQKITLSDRLIDMTVTEKNECMCKGIEGELPEVITLGEKHDYVHLSRGANLLATVEYFDGKTQVYDGQWIDPFDLKEI